MSCDEIVRMLLLEVTVDTATSLSIAKAAMAKLYLDSSSQIAHQMFRKAVCGQNPHPAAVHAYFLPTSSCVTINSTPTLQSL